MLARLALIILLAASFGLAVRHAHASNDDGRWDNAPLHDWYSRLHNREGAVCCDEAEVRPVERWDHAENGGFTVTIDGQAWDVPRSQIVDGVNKFGDALVWAYPLHDTNAPVTGIRCFLPGTEG